MPNVTVNPYSVTRHRDGSISVHGLRLLDLMLLDEANQAATRLMLRDPDPATLEAGETIHKTISMPFHQMRLSLEG